MTLSNYLRNTKSVYFPKLCQQFDYTPRKAISELSKYWNQLHVFDNMIMWGSDTRRWYYEVCDTKYNRGEYIPAESIQPYWNTNKKVDQHYSMFAHDDKWVENCNQNGSVSCEHTLVKAPLFWIEIDRKNPDGTSNFQKALNDARKLRRKFIDIYESKGGNNPSTICWVFTSGNNSAHVAFNMSLFGNPITRQKWCGRGKVWYNLAHRIAGDLRYDNSLVDPYFEEPDYVESFYVLEHGEAPPDKQKMMQVMENIDPNMYSVNSLIRLPWSVHEKSGLPKSLYDKDFVYTPQPLNITQEPPLFLDWWIDSFTEKKKPRKHNRTLDSNISTDYIIEEYAKYYPDILDMIPDSDGWVGRFHNYFYSDGNPDVLINVENGYHHDFGSSVYSLTFNEFLAEVKSSNNTINN